MDNKKTLRSSLLQDVQHFPSDTIKEVEEELRVIDGETPPLHAAMRNVIGTPTRKAREEATHTFTWRSTLIGLLIGSLIVCQNMYFFLKSGVGFGGAFSAALVGWGTIRLISTQSSFPFSDKEHCYLMTTAVATGGGAIAFGFVGPILALSSTFARNSGAPANFPSLDMPWYWMVVFCTALCALGIFLAVPFRQKMIVEDELPFPSGKATAALIVALQRGSDKARDMSTALFRSFVPSFLLKVVRFVFVNLDFFPIFGYRATCFGWWSDWSTAFLGAAMLMPTSVPYGMMCGAVVSLLLELFLLGKEGSWFVTPPPLLVPNPIGVPCESALNNLTGVYGYIQLTAVAIFFMDAVWMVSETLFAEFNKDKSSQADDDLPVSPAVMNRKQDGSNRRKSTATGDGLERFSSFSFQAATGFSPDEMIEPRKKSKDSTKRHSGAFRLAVPPRQSRSRVLGAVDLDATAVAAATGDRSASINASSAAATADLNLSTDSAASAAAADASSVDTPEDARSKRASRQGSYALAELGNDDDDEIPRSWWIGGIIVSIIVILAILPVSLHFSSVGTKDEVLLDGNMYVSALFACIVAPLIGYFVVYTYGKSDQGLVLLAGKIITAVVVIWSDNVILGLGLATIGSCLCVQACDTCQIMKSAYLLDASPKYMLVGQLIGAFFSIPVGILTYYLFTSAYTIPSQDFEAPLAGLFQSIAILFSKETKKPDNYEVFMLCGILYVVAYHGLGSLVKCLCPPPQPSAAAAAARESRKVPVGLGIDSEAGGLGHGNANGEPLHHDDHIRGMTFFSWEWWQMNWYSIFPLPFAFALGLYIPSQVSLDFMLGAVVKALWEKYNLSSFHDNHQAVAAGLISGEGIGGVAMAVCQLIVSSGGPVHIHY